LVERGHIDHLTVTTVRRCLEAVEVKLDLQPRWRGADLDRLLDEGHATLQAAWKGRLEEWDWAVVAEASFNQYGDRGRIDLLAWHPVAQRLAVIEIKTELADAQGLLGRWTSKCASRRVWRTRWAGVGRPASFPS
jgi:hypothetical protein